MVTEACVHTGSAWRSCIVCGGSSQQRLADSFPWVTPVSDTLSAAYMPPTPPLLHPSLCAFFLFPLRTIFPLRFDSSSLTLLPSVSSSHRVFALSSSLLLALFKNSPPPTSSSPHLTPYPSFSFLFPVSWLDSIGVCAPAPGGQSRREGGRWRRGVEGEMWRVPFSIRTKHACGASRHQLEMQSGPLSWHPGWGRGAVQGGGTVAAVVWWYSTVNVIVLGRSHRSPGPHPPQSLDTFGRNRSQWPAMRRANSEHDAL